jgi:hypothetical protein
MSTSARYLLNMDGKVIHKYPAFEECNTDQIANKYHVNLNEGTDTNEDESLSEFTVAYLQNEKGYKLCQHCFPEGEGEGEGEGSGVGDVGHE